VLFASLVDDPESDPDVAKLSGDTREQWIGEERSRLHRLIEELVPWENLNNASVIRAARAEIARCVASLKVERGELTREESLPGGETVGSLVCKGRVSINERGMIDDLRLPNARSVNAFLVKHAPPVLDPFCGGGSILLEAQRLGLRVYASDLNPVPVLTTKALIEIPPKFAGRPPVNPDWQRRSVQEKALTRWEGAKGLAEDIHYYGKWMRDEAEKRIGHLYPKVKITAATAEDRPDLKPYLCEELTVVAWLWARTVASPNPVVEGAHVPLVTSFWLSKKKGKEAWVEPVLNRKMNNYRFRVRVGEPDDPVAIDAGTKLGRGCKFRCLLSDEPIPDAHVKSQGMAGKLSTRLMAIVAEGARGRVYLSPTMEHAESALIGRPGNASSIEAPIAPDKRAIWCLLYGLDRFDKLFTNRQLTALVTFSDLVGEARAMVLADARTAGNSENGGRSLEQGGIGPQGYADSVATYLACSVNNLLDDLVTLCSWRPTHGTGAIGHAFSRQAIPMIWDFPEANPFADAAGDLSRSISAICRCIKTLPLDVQAGDAKQRDATTLEATSHQLIVSTDPPYYDNIGYADPAP
jgi:putative DNA methylase